MRSQPRLLINTPEIELWPAGLLRARSNHDARAIARARHVLRRKRDGRYLAAVLPEGLLPLVQRLMREPGIDYLLSTHSTHIRCTCVPASMPIGELPLDRLLDRLDALGLDEGYGEASGLPLVPEPELLGFAGFDRYRRPLWLHPSAARAWLHMRDAAGREGRGAGRDFRLSQPRLPARNLRT